MCYYLSLKKSVHFKKKTNKLLMKKAFFIALLALAMPFFASAQLSVEILSLQYESPYALIVHPHVYGADGLADGDTMTLRISYGYPGDLDEHFDVNITNQNSTHFEFPITGLTPDTEYEYSACLLNPGDPEPVTCDFSTVVTDEVDLEEPQMEEDINVEDVMSYAAAISGEIEDFGDYMSIEAFNTYSEDPYIVEDTSYSIEVFEPYGDFTTDLFKLKPQKLYHVWSCGRNLSGTECSDRGFFNTKSLGPVDIEIEDYEQVGTCSMSIQFSVFAGNRPDQIEGTLKVGNPGEMSFYTSIFSYDMDVDNEMEIIIDYAPIVMAGIDLDPMRTIFVLTMDSYGVSGKVSGVLPFGGEACNDEFGFIGEGDDLRMIEDNTINIFPNPATEMISVQNEEHGTLNLFDVAGRFIRGYQVDAGFTEIHIDYLTAGAYFFEFINSEGEKITQKIIKQ